MLSAIASDPTALPLWVVFLFAVAMYPLGILLPGCPCCGSACTQCGVLATGYKDPQNANGRMCCTGTLAPSVTLRVTNVGPATGITVSRTGGTPYTKTTKTYDCTGYLGDYVLPSTRVLSPTAGYSCGWYVGDGTIGWRFYIFPAEAGAFPDYRLRLQANFGYRLVTSRIQSCSGYPDIESCNVGFTTTANQEMYVDETAIGSPGAAYVSGGTLSVQKCSPAGLLAFASLPVFVTGIDTQCRVKLEVVA